ncbi:U4/U6 x U5 tri-snRNP complex subunit Prp1, partial [Coemansia sp. RSA 2603]
MYPVTKDFLGKPAPPGYVAGLGRGATGFTTRSDIGPARENTDSSAKNTRDATADDDATARFADAANEEGLLSSVAAGDASDEEADRIWAQIDQKMSHRRRKPLKPASEKDVNEPVDDQVTRDLQTLKRQLGTVSAEEWAAIPDAAQVAETAARAKRRRKAAGSARQGDRLAPASDSLLLAAFGVTPGAAHTEARDVTDFVALGQARDDVLRLTLDRLAPAASSEASVDRSGYLTSLAQPSASAAVADVGRARELLRSVTQANPRHAAAWIARARVEEMSDGGRPRARAVMAQACERCARSEDVWLEAARLAAGTQDARAVLAQAARHVPRSVRVWTMAAELEPQVAVQRRVLRRALEHVPGSSELWQKLVALEDNPDEARVLLAHAVDVAPHSADL